MKCYNKRFTYLLINVTISLLLGYRTLLAQECQFTYGLGQTTVKSELSQPWNLKNENPNSAFPNYRYDFSAYFKRGNNPQEVCPYRLPLFKDKTFCLGLTGGSQCTFHVYDGAALCPSNGEGPYGIIYASSLSDFSCDQSSYSFGITSDKLNTATRIDCIAKWWAPNSNGSWSRAYFWYSSFTISVVPGPEWRDNLNAICNEDEIKLEDFTTTPNDGEIRFYHHETGELIPRDNVRRGTFLKKSEIPRNAGHPGNFTLRMERTYDNGIKKREKVIDLLPDPPRIDQQQMTLTPSCHERSTGKIFIPSSAITTSEANISWVLRKGYDTSPCAGSNCAANTVRSRPLKTLFQFPKQNFF